MKLLISIVLVVFSSSVLADVLVVNTFQPLAGGAPQSFAYAQEAKAIHEGMGAQVTIGATVEGNMDYVMAFDNWEAYGIFSKAIATNERWLAFQAKIAREPSATQIDNVMLTSVALGEPVGPGGMYQVFKWEPGTGAGAVQNLMQGGTGAKPIHESAGARVSVYRDPLNNMHYVMMFEDAQAWGKYQDTPIPEFQAYMQTLDNSGPEASVLVRVTTGTIQ